MDQNLKQRLVGASVIVALAVIFVPMLFDGKPVQGEHQVELHIPDKPDLPPLEKRSFRIDEPVSQAREPNPPMTSSVDMETAIEPEPVKTIVAAEKTHHQRLAEQQHTEASSEKEPTASAKTPVTPKKTPHSNKQPTVASAAKPAPQPSAKPPDSGSSAAVFRVKIGSFSQRANAEKVRGKLLLAKVPTAISKDDSRTLFYVYSPEFTQQAQAQVYAEKVIMANRQGALGLGKPAIVRLSPKDSEAITRQTAKAWVVQAGSFSRLENARKLRDKLRAQGYTAFVDKASMTAQSLYRVRVGPEVKRAEAEKTRARLQKKLQIRGVIRPHELSDVIE